MQDFILFLFLNTVQVLVAEVESTSSIEFVEERVFEIILNVDIDLAFEL